MAAWDELDRIERLVASGEYLGAYDAAANADPAGDWSSADRVRLRYLRALTLARSGASQRAGAELAAIADVDTPLPSAVREDIAALDARLAKDRALSLSGQRRKAAAAEAAQRYQDVYQVFGRPFACVNAATMWLIAGEPEKAATLARRARDLARAAPATSELDSYWTEVTDAEASLVLGDVDRARSCLRSAGPLATGDLGARASTRRQLTALCVQRGIDPAAVLADIANPAVIHYTGHAPEAEGTARSVSVESLAAAAEAVRVWMATHRICAAFGSLASGADILVAEAVVEQGLELHVVLPFSIEEFLAVSVLPAGAEWLERFRECLDAATSVTVTCDSGFQGDTDLFSLASRVAMGQAALRAHAIGSEAVQVALWDRRTDTQSAGTAHDVARWQASGRTTHVIEVEREGHRAAPGPESSVPPRRQVRALLFGDVVGFSKLRDEEIAAFCETTLPRFRATIDQYASALTDSNTWGDALLPGLRQRHRRGAVCAGPPA